MSSIGPGQKQGRNRHLNLHASNAHPNIQEWFTKKLALYSEQIIRQSTSGMPMSLTCVCAKKVPESDSVSHFEVCSGHWLPFGSTGIIWFYDWGDSVTNCFLWLFSQFPFPSTPFYTVDISDSMTMVIGFYDYFPSELRWKSHIFGLGVLLFEAISADYAGHAV